MSEQKVFDINDRETGKVYRVRSDAPDATREEAIDFITGLTDEERASFEYDPAPQEQPQQKQAPAPTPQESGPVAVSGTDGYVDVTNDPIHQAAVDRANNRVPDAQTETVAQGALFDEDPRNPLERELSGRASQLEQMIAGGAPDEQVREFASQIKQETGTTISGLEENLKRRREGKDVGQVQITGLNAVDQALQAEQPKDPGDRTGSERLSDSFMDAVQYGFNGWVARKGHDWLDSSKDQLRQGFPGRDEEWYEEMHDYMIVNAQKKLRTEAQMLQELDPNWRPDDSFFENVLATERYVPWFLGQIAGSAGPEMAIAPGASLGARATAQSIIGATSDIGYQTLDITDNVEDQLSWESVALNGLMGAGGETILTGVARTAGLDSARGKGVNSTEVRNARFPRVMDELDETIVPRTTTDRRTKAYRTETAAAMQSIADRVNVLTQDWTNAPEFVVQEDFKKIGGLDDNALGVYRSDGSVYLNTDAILAYAKRRGVSADDVVRSVVFHEGLGHHGLASRYGSELNTVMKSFYDQGDSDFRTRVDNYMDSTGETDVTLATEETLAILSERGELPVRMMDRLVTFFRQWAREVPWVGQNLKFTDNEIRTLLAMSQRETTQGARVQGGGGPDKYMTTYHGSPREFKPTARNPLGEFDHSFMSTGEGVQAFGYGTYLSDLKSIATGYRDALSKKTVSWNGVEGQWYNVRANAQTDIQRRFDQEGQVMADDILTYMGSVGQPTRAGFDDWWGPISGGYDPRFIDKIYNYIDKNMSIKSEGKLYEVELPDDSKFLEWEETLDSQRDLERALEDNGYTVTNYATWNMIQRDAYKARLDYQTANNRLDELDTMIREAQETGQITAGAERFDVQEGEVAQWERAADEIFETLQELSIKRNKTVERARKYFHEDMTGEDVYSGLAGVLGSDKAASEFFAANGFTGNRYLAANIRDGRARANDGTDKFNYVVFDDKTPVIKNKYSKASYDKARELSNEWAYSKNSDKRMLAEVFWMSKQVSDNPSITTSEKIQQLQKDLAGGQALAKSLGDDGVTVWRASLENLENVYSRTAGVPPAANDKYMKPRDLQDTTPITPEELSADELFDSMNAFDILKRITPDGERTVYNMEDLQSDAAARGVPPSALLKKATEGEGSLSKSLFMYDLAAQKMNERVTRLYGKIQSGNYTMKDKDNYLKTILQFEDLTAKIFSQQSEVGRALRAIQEMEFTSNRVTTLRDVLRGLDSGLEGLDDPATFERFARQLDEKLRLDEANSKGLQNPVIQTLNVPRAVMSSMDLSAPLRQGLFFITKPAYWKAFLDMHTSFFSQKKYDAIMDDITKRPTYEAMVKARLAFSRIDEGAPLSAREEDFQTDLAAQIPVIGRGVKASNRAYSAFRNKLSADMFDHYYRMMEKSGLDMKDLNHTQGMAAFINAATGRGNLPKFLQSAGPQLNSVFFSPRLIMSRLNLLNPVFYYKLPPVVRREALIQAAAMGSLATLTLGTIDHFVPDAEVEFDPRHTDFGKVRVGNTRFDVLGGFAQFIRLGARLATGRTISSSDRISEYKAAPFIQGIHDGLKGLYEYSTGEAVAPSTPSNPAYAQTLKDSISQFLENKFSPNASYINDMLKGEDFIGNEFDPVDGALSRVMPMYFQDMAELASEDGPGPIATGFGVVSSLYGVGSNTYVTSSLDTDQELEAPETMTDKDLADGENEWVTVSNGTITLKPQAREMYENRLNNYFSQIMEYEMSQDNWSEIERSTQADIIKKAKAEARREARKDMRRLYGID